jgi:predicted dehydrogenase
MIAACEAAGVHLLMAMVLRFFPAYNKLVEAIHTGRIGRPVTASLLRQGFYPTGRDNWFRDDEQSGGVLLDLLIHDFDWVLWQFGPAERVYAKLVQRTGASPFAQGMVTVRHQSGVLSQVTGTWGHPGPFTTAVEIAGNAGLLSACTEDTQPLRLLTPPATMETTGVALPDLSAAENPYRIQLAHFVDVVARGATPLVTSAEALAALTLALAARQSATTGQPVALDEVKQQ